MNSRKIDMSKMFKKNKTKKQHLPLHSATEQFSVVFAQPGQAFGFDKSTQLLFRYFLQSGSHLVHAVHIVHPSSLTADKNPHYTATVHLNKYTWYFFRHTIPRHIPPLQMLVMTSWPGQYFPPLLGLGFVQLLCFLFLQSGPQVDHDDHEVHPPSIAVKEETIRH